MRFILFAFILLAQAAQAAAQNLPATSEEFDQIKIGGAQLYKPAKPFRDQRIITLQIIMDRAGFSPGVIDV